MGARQSVAQPSRNQQRTQSNAVVGSAVNDPSANGHTVAGPSGLTAGFPRASRSYSVPSGPAPRTRPVVAGRSAEKSNEEAGASSDDSGDETPSTSAAAFGLTGIPSLDQLLSSAARRTLTVGPRTGTGGHQSASSAIQSRTSLPPGQLSSLLAFKLFDIKCPVCNKSVPSDDAECHLVMCLTRPRITYNEDVVTDENGKECIICLEELAPGETIARLPCLCIYHKKCIDAWFGVKNCCPEHPGDD